jgi:hypothetical protein
VLSPRIDNEYLKPFRAYFQQKFEKDFILKGRKDPESIVKWVRESITTDEQANYSRAPLTPCGAYDLRVADPHSRDIFFVAVCRSFGIPARLETATRIPQYFFRDKWQDVYFTHPQSKLLARGKIVLSSDPANGMKPEYYTHFTIEKLEDGFFRSLDYETDPVLQHFPATIEVPSGSYLLVTGNRISGGTVLTKLTFFNLEENKTQDLTLELRRDPAPAIILGKIPNMDNFFLKVASVKAGSKKGTILAWLDPEKEPSRHFIADLIEKKQELDKWNGSILLLFKTPKDKEIFIKKNAGIIPKMTKCAVGETGSLEQTLMLLNKKAVNDLPAVAFIDGAGNVTYFSEGYKFGFGNEILGYLKPQK